MTKSDVLLGCVKRGRLSRLWEVIVRIICSVLERYNPEIRELILREVKNIRMTGRCMSPKEVVWARFRNLGNMSWARDA